MGLKISISEVESRIQEITKVINKNKENVKSINDKINTYTGNKNLSGNAYTNSKEYLSTIYIPLLSNLSQVNNDIVQKSGTIMGKFHECVGNTEGFETDTDKLEALKAQIENTNKKWIMQRQNLMASSFLSLNLMNYWMIKAIDEKIRLNNEKIKKIDKIIKGIYAFSSQCAGLFSGCNCAMATLNATTKQIEAGNFNSANKAIGFSRNLNAKIKKDLTPISAYDKAASSGLLGLEAKMLYEKGLDKDKGAPKPVSTGAVSVDELIKSGKFFPDPKKAKNDYPTYIRGGSHRGKDFSGDKGTPINSIVDGEVIKVVNFYPDYFNMYGKVEKEINGDPGIEEGDIRTYGNRIIVKTIIDGKEYHVYYAHLSQTEIQHVNVGDTITKGTVIGLVGNTGNSSGAHLHIEVRKDPFTYGSDVNPDVLLRKIGEK